MASAMNEKTRDPEDLELEGVEQWRRYIEEDNFLTIDTEGYLRQLEDMGSKLFCLPEKMHVDLIDIFGKNQIVSSSAPLME